MQGMYIGSHGKEIGVFQRQWQCGGADTLMALTRRGQGDNGTGPAQVRQGQCNDDVTTEVTWERENS
jgi:hypothetical protein